MANYAATHFARRRPRLSMDRGWTRSAAESDHRKRATIAASFEQRPANDTLNLSRSEQHAVFIAKNLQREDAAGTIKRRVRRVRRVVRVQ
jgi:hypothetical protein